MRTSRGALSRRSPHAGHCCPSSPLSDVSTFPPFSFPPPSPSSRARARLLSFRSSLNPLTPARHGCTHACTRVTQRWMVASPSLKSVAPELIARHWYTVDFCAARIAPAAKVSVKRSVERSARFSWLGRQDRVIVLSFYYKLSLTRCLVIQVSRKSWRACAL